MSYYVYILYSERTFKFYKGHTNDLESRIRRHNGGHEKYTRDGVPWRLLWKTPKPDRSECYKLEMKLKNLTRVRLVGFMLKHKEGITSADALLELKQWSAS